MRRYTQNKLQSFIAWALALAMICIFGLLMTACGVNQLNSGFAPSEDFKQRLFVEPKTQLKNIPQTATPTYDVYDISEVRAEADEKVISISAHAVIKSSAGEEKVDLVGTLRDDGSASLLDIAPLKNGLHRLVGEAFCADIGKCKAIILNLYFNVGGKVHKRQFVTGDLLANYNEPSAHEGHSGHAKDNEEWHESEKGLSDDPDDSERIGQFIGAPRNEGLIGKLVNRPEDAVIVDDKMASIELVVPPPIPTLSRPDQPKPAPVPPKATSPSNNKMKQVTPGWFDQLKKWWDATFKPQAPPSQTQKPKPAELSPQKKDGGKNTRPAKAPEPLRPLITVASAPQEQVIVRPSVPTGQIELPVQPVAQSSESQSWPVPTATVPESATDMEKRIALLEAKVAPLLNLRDGGVAVGRYGSGSLKHASLLPESGNGFKSITVNGSAHYGSGMLVSFLQNAAQMLTRDIFPGLNIYVGDMSKKSGGSFGSSSDHNTHQNGLDADIAYLAVSHPLVDSILNSDGEVVSHFDYAKTWSFLKIALEQSLVLDARKVTAINRIYMSPAVKNGFCEWAKANDHLKTDDDILLMRLIRRTKGHHKHFHLSLKCSPHYPLCRDLQEPPEGSGCD